MADLPSGTVTFLFTDIEGSTRLVKQLRDQYADLLADHERILRTSFTEGGGHVMDTQGDSFFVAFRRASDAVAASVAAQRALAAHDWPRRVEVKVRIGLHTGEPSVGGERYVGLDVHKAARVCAAAHGGQVLVSATTGALVDEDLAEGVSLRDVGTHALKDLDRPERLFQLVIADLPTEFPPPRAPAPAPLFDEAPPLTTFDKRLADLPIPPTPLIGRERELNEIVRFTRTHRLVTLTGPGGSGKTRLALAAAAKLVDEFSEGVWFVSLATLADPQLIEPTIAGALGAQDGLADFLRGKKLLLLLDNLEQLLPDVAPIISGLGAHLLATSRERLNVAGEQEFPVPALPLEDAVALFAQRARQLKPAFEPDTHVPEIARRLDGLPLAIELAAARVKALTAQQILERLGHSLDLLTAGARDAPARQRTLRATIEWSYELLTPPEQRLFERLAAFAGSFDLEAAEAVCDGDLDTVETLVDKSLLRQTDEGRFFMLETIREYAAERLHDLGEAEELGRRHAEHFLALAEEAEPNLPVHPREWLERLECEHNNLRAVLDRLDESGEGELASRLAGALSRFWNMSGHLAEGRRRLEVALRSDERPTAARAKALNGAALLALATEDLATARLWAEEGLALHRQLGDAWGTAQAGFLLGNVVSGQGDLPRAQQLFEESVRRFRELGDEHYTLLATLNLAWPCHLLGDRERARALYEHVVRRARATSDERIEALSLERLAEYALDEGRVQEAVSMLKDSLRIYRGGPMMTADSLTQLARALAVKGSAETAARILSSSAGLYEEIGAVRSWAARMTEETLATIRTQLEEAAFAEAWEQGRALTVDEAIALAFDS
jgi:predicted ATPase/class 3 adenylate cyclase